MFCVVKALPLLGTEPFFHLNSDTMWIDGVQSNLARLADAFDPDKMDILLLMAPTASSIGYKGAGDYAMAADGTLKKKREGQVVPFVYAGAAIMKPDLFAGAPHGAFELPKAIFDKAEAKGRLFGLRLEGVWVHVADARCDRRRRASNSWQAWPDFRARPLLPRRLLILLRFSELDFGWIFANEHSFATTD